MGDADRCIHGFRGEEVIVDEEVRENRVGCKAAKGQEALDRAKEIIHEDERILYRALEARTVYLSMDRPDSMYSSKELRREFASPARARIQKLKHLVRYLVTRPRLVWHVGQVMPLSFRRRLFTS